MKKTSVFYLILILAVIGVWYFLARSTPNPNLPIDSLNSDPLNTSYLIEGERIQLKNGLAEIETTPDSTTKNKFSIFGVPSFGDIDKDGDDDAVLILLNEPGGSGTFYYAAIAANINGEYQGTDTILLGDRIAPQNTSIVDNKALINYAVRNPGEDFTIQPSLGKSLYLQFDPENLQLIYIEPNFSGEADPQRMQLEMQTWNWIRTISENEIITPKKEKVFTLSFGDNQMFSATTDCNSILGHYEVVENKIFFTNVAATMMACENSQEAEFSKIFAKEQSFFFTGKGELIFNLPLDSGSAVFQ